MADARIRCRARDLSDSVDRCAMSGTEQHYWSSDKVEAGDDEPTIAATQQLILTTKLTRIAVLNSHPIQYFAPLYAYLNAAPDLDVTALYLSDFSIRGGKDAGFGRDVKWDVDLLAGYRSVFLGEAARTREPGGFWSLVAPQVWNELRRAAMTCFGCTGTIMPPILSPSWPPRAPVCRS